ncbi:MAG: hypothetical protein EU530_03415 [Promethearchaeota archaeon]|nr:MAG: hypothetical protein EU530_03415 [Candidatus Lokiarchaeota archaeon]
MHDSEETSSNPKDGESEEVDHELEKIRLKRMESLLRQQQQSQRPNTSYTQQDKIRMVLQAIMTPEAFRYYLSIKDRDENLANRILQIVLPPTVMRELDLLIQYLSQGMLRSNIIDMLQIQQLERKILGIGPKITVKKRDGESTDLNSFLKSNNK